MANEVKIITRADQVKANNWGNLPESAQQLLLDSYGYKMERQQSREAALEWILSGYGSTWQLTLLLLDSIGLGGRQGLGSAFNGNTKRLSVFQKLGSGRKFALDADCYNKLLEIQWFKSSELVATELGNGARGTPWAEWDAKGLWAVFATDGGTTRTPLIMEECLTNLEEDELRATRALVGRLLLARQENLDLEMVTVWQQGSPTTCNTSTSLGLEQLAAIFERVVEVLETKTQENTEER